MEYIRVLVKTSDYDGVLHKEIVLTADSDFSLQYGTGDAVQTEYFAAGTEVVLQEDGSYFAGERVRVVPSVLTGKIYLKNVSRSSGNTGYRGHLELQKAEDGIAVINELLLEEYLYSVVPSEMPASYPAEALRAQAICARTYAYGYMLHAGYPQYGAHVDDSTSYQVYNNIAEQESATTAVKETFGQLLVTPENYPAETFYYSTSCGVGTDAGVWSGDGMSDLAYLTSKVHNFTTLQKEVELRNMEDGLDYPQMEGQTESLTEKPSMAMTENVPQLLSQEEVFAAYITEENPDDFEVNEIWYRWNYHVPELNRKTILKALQSRYAANPQLVLTLKDGEFVSAPIKELSQIKELYISKRGSGGVAAELVIDTGKHTYKVLTENSIRYVLCSGEDVVIRQDGSESTPGTLLPSGFFVLEAEKAGGKEDGKVIGYKLTGGGFGHGVGMSQNGAKNMAAAGYKAEDILKFYYEGCDVRHIYTE